MVVEVGHIPGEHKSMQDAGKYGEREYTILQAVKTDNLARKQHCGTAQAVGVEPLSRSMAVMAVMEKTYQSDSRATFSRNTTPPYLRRTRVQATNGE